MSGRQQNFVYFILQVSQQHMDSYRLAEFLVISENT